MIIHLKVRSNFNFSHLGPKEISKNGRQCDNMVLKYTQGILSFDLLLFHLIHMEFGRAGRVIMV